jgi:5-formyltetrahydrofolate cyclo-ligase
LADKNKLRKEVKEKLSKIAKQEYEQYSYQLAQRLYNEESWKKAGTIGITVSRFPEPDTLQIIRRAWEEGKRVAVPKCFPADRRMEFRMLSSFLELESVYYGLLEPIESLTEKIEPEEIALTIVPGLAYSSGGLRLGFGGGYYDRWLAGYGGNTIALAFRMQMVTELPVEPHDKKIDMIITAPDVV